MSLARNGVGLTGVAVVLVTLLACREGHPPTGIDPEVPVQELEGWSGLVGDLNLTAPEQSKLARWVLVFRQGLHSARSARTPAERAEYEQAWWDEAQRSLPVVAGAERVSRVTEWLEATFERRGDGS